MYSVANAAPILSRTPAVLSALLSGLDESWTTRNEGSNTWSPYDVIGHLIHGEKTDWIPRMRMILSDQVDKRFPPFDMTAHFTESKGKSLAQLLDEFGRLRSANVDALGAANLDEIKLAKTGIHPDFGTVTLAQHLATWVAHDFDHIVQISRTMAKRYQSDVGPWVQYLRVLRS